MQEIPENQPANGESETQHSGKKHIPEQVEAISDSISRMYNQFRESEQYEEIEEKAVKLKDYIQDNPVPSMLYSLGAGFILGLLLHRKK